MTTFTTENFTTSIEVVNKPFTTLNGREAVILFEVFQINETQKSELIEEMDNIYQSRGSDWDLCYDNWKNMWENNWYVCKDIKSGNWFEISKYWFECNHDEI